MNNSVFGKTQENLRNRVNVEVITKRDVALKRACKPSFKRSMTVRSDIVVMQCTVPNLQLNKPVYIGFSVLDLSKLHVYRFHYEKMLSMYENDVRLCFSDTDSLFYETKQLIYFKIWLNTLMITILVITQKIIIYTIHVTRRKSISLKTNSME